MPVACVPQFASRKCGRHPECHVTGFCRWTDLPDRARHIDHAELLRPQIIFRHIGKTAERSDPARAGDSPAGFLEDLAVQGGDGRFSRINPATRQLEFWQRLCLMGQQQICTPRQDGIGPRPALVDLPLPWRFTEPSDHSVTPCTGHARRRWQPFPWCLPCPAYIHAVCQETALKETP